MNNIERLVDREVERQKTRKNKSIVQAPSKLYEYKKIEEEAERERKRADHDYLIYRSAELEFERSPITEVPDEVKFPNDFFEDAQRKREYNQVYADYYMQRYEDTNLDKYERLSQNIANCHKQWFGDRYKQSGIFNVKRVFHCHNRWCWLCNHLEQAKRLYKYHVRFEDLLKKYDLYHVVFTVPNCKGDVLKDTLNRMHASCFKIIRYFQGHVKIAGHDFLQYGFVGAVRSFEIVIYPTEYHPHIHCLFMLKKDLNLIKTETNRYSFNNGKFERKFSKLEILLQKIFYLAFNKKKVNEKNLEATPYGYSCIMDFVEGKSWQEVFKYATKMSKYGASSCTYEQFVLLDDILHRMKMVQGYGIFYNVEKVKDENAEQAAILFEKVLILLGRKEKPERDISIALDKLVDELHEKKLTVISKKMSYKYLKTIIDDLKADMQVEDGFEPF